MKRGLELLSSQILSFARRNRAEFSTYEYSTLEHMSDDLAYLADNHKEKEEING